MLVFSFILLSAFTLSGYAQKRMSIEEINKAAAKQEAQNELELTPTQITWDKLELDFGKIKHQVPATATFKLTNNGKTPLTITEVAASCGCTSPSYTKEPIKPGETGEVKLTYDSKISGIFIKTAYVKTADGQKFTLKIKGEVTTEM